MCWCMRVLQAGAVRAVEHSVMDFATFQKKPAILDKKYLAKSGLAVINTPVSNTPTRFCECAAFPTHHGSCANYDCFVPP